MVKARMRCTGNFAPFEGAEMRQINLAAVYSNDPDDPNRSYSVATPSANLSMYVTNAAAFDQFEVNKVYDVEFSPVPE